MWIKFLFYLAIGLLVAIVYAYVDKRTKNISRKKRMLIQCAVTLLIVILLAALYTLLGI